MANCAIVGINWGDEGKGRMVDYLTGQYDVVVRYQGGGNAGHTVINDMGKFALHLLPSGVFRPGVMNILGNGVALDCENLVTEMETIRAAGVSISPKNLMVSHRASLLLPWHRELDALEEARLKDKMYGSTKQGIAPFYSDKYQKKTIQAGELLYPDRLMAHLQDLLEWKNLILQKVYGAKGYTMAEMTAWLEDWLRRFKGGLVMVTHDRYFLERVVNHITELSRGKLYHYEANYSKYLELKAQRTEMAEASERKRQSILRTEREWIMRGCRARTTKSKDRIERYEALKNQEAPETDDTVQLAAASSRLGKKLIELHDVSKSYEGRTVIRDFSYNLLRNDRIGIVGHNGAGKSTLLRLFAGELSPDSGTVDIGTTVKIGHFSQEGRELDLNQRVYDFIHDIGDEVRTDEGTFTAKAMMERFLFPSDLQSVPIGRLSGGERRRLYLLSILMEAPNVLLLDEPTNDLDVMTLSILEDYLQGFPGPILIVSHDRFLLDKLAEQVFEVRDGEVLRYSGNWSDWKAKRKEEEAPAKAEKPKAAQERPRERKLKFTFKEQREFETIDEDLAALEQQIRECEEAQGACGSDYVRLQELQAKQAELEAALEEKTERWMYLTELKEKIDAQ